MTSSSKRWTTSVKSRFGPIRFGFKMVEVDFFGYFLRSNRKHLQLAFAVPWPWASDRPLFTSHVRVPTPCASPVVTTMSSKRLWCQVLLSLWQLSDLPVSLQLWEVASLFESSLHGLTVRLRLFYPNSKQLQLLLTSSKYMSLFLPVKWELQ